MAEWKKRQRWRKRRPLPELSEAQILAWADAHHQGTGHWPNVRTGAVRDAPDERWRYLDTYLRQGLRGLQGGTSLARLLARQRGVRNNKALPKLTETIILAWADAHHRRAGRWPKRTDGPIVDAPGETWLAVQTALANGLRGMPGRSSLSELLARRRGVRNHMDLPRLKVRSILAWADAHFKRTVRWPHADSGPILEAPGETWLAVDMALRQGSRGFAGGSSLARLLEIHRGVRNVHNLPPLTIEGIVHWADAHHDRTERWPTAKAGAIPEAPGETWARVSTALLEGLRGLRAGSSLARLLAKHRGVPNRMELPKLNFSKIVRWAKAYQRRTGKWPTAKSGPVEGVPGQTWRGIAVALQQGLRGLRQGLSLARLKAAADSGEKVQKS